MLRFRRDRLHIGLEPDRLTLVRLSGAPTAFSAPRVMASTLLSLDESATESARVEALAQFLREPKWQNAKTHIVLGDRLVRYFVAERPPGARNVEEVRLAAALRFEDIFAVSAAEWEIRLDMPPLATHQLGCALRKFLVTALVRACAEANAPVATLVPHAVAEFNRAHSVIGGEDGWFAVSQRHSLWVGRKKGSDWLSAHQHALTGDHASEFSRIMAQEYLRASPPAAPPPTVWVCGFLDDPMTRQRLASSSARLLGAPCWPGQPEAWNAPYRLALSPVWPTCV